MEKLVYVAWFVGLAGLLLIAAGGWVVHTAINDGNIWKGLVGGILVIVGVRPAMAFLALVRE